LISFKNNINLYLTKNLHSKKQKYFSIFNKNEKNRTS